MPFTEGIDKELTAVLHLFNVCQTCEHICTTAATPLTGRYSPTYPHVVEWYSHYVTEVFAEERNLGVPLAEVVQHDELSIHLHADTDGLGGCAVRKHEA